MAILVFFSFLSGIVTILSPCILPVLPIVLSGTAGGEKRPAGVITGFILSFTVFTLSLSSIVKALSIPPDILRTIAIMLILLFGAVMLIPSLNRVFEKAASLISGKFSGGKQKKGFTGGLLTGASLGLVWTPCVGPIMASVITLAVSSRVDGGAVLIVLAYSAGTSLPMLGIMAGSRKIIRRFPVLARRTGSIQRVFGALMIITALLLFTGLDRKFQTAVLDIFPEYGTGLTAFENTEKIKSALEGRSSSYGTDMGENTFSAETPPENGNTGNYGKAPEINSGGSWFNYGEFKTDIIPSMLKIDDLKGKVVLLDFWTYSCINCIRTIPHLKALYDTYSSYGFVIIGIHTPEFAFERNIRNVEAAIEDLGVSWPVVTDNYYSTWKSYNNRYWPAHYFIDAEGSLRYYSFGEGHYDTTEAVIRKLLIENGKLPQEKAETVPASRNEAETPETYLGYSRADGFISEPETVKGKTAFYRAPGRPGNGEWTLEGEWLIGREYIQPESTGILTLNFNSADLFLVIEPGTEKGYVEVEIDGNTAPDTADVRDGIITPEESRLYRLLEDKKGAEHILTLKVHGDLKLFAFTFG